MEAFSAFHSCYEGELASSFHASGSRTFHVPVKKEPLPLRTNNQCSCPFFLQVAGASGQVFSPRTAPALDPPLSNRRSWSCWAL